VDWIFAASSLPLIVCDAPQTACFEARRVRMVGLYRPFAKLAANSYHSGLYAA